jgi:hypothetical protein
MWRELSKRRINKLMCTWNILRKLVNSFNKILTTYKKKLKSNINKWKKAKLKDDDVINLLIFHLNLKIPYSLNLFN